MNTVLIGDALERLKELESNSVDCLVTDPPYGYSFMGKDWDRAVPDMAIWKECLRVLKPGSFAFIMSAPRLDVQSEMARRVQEAGFNIAFTPLYWTYFTGMPKGTNLSKMADKKLGAKRNRIKVPKAAPTEGIYGEYSGEIDDSNPITPPGTDAERGVCWFPAQTRTRSHSSGHEAP